MYNNNNNDNENDNNKRVWMGLTDWQQRAREYYWLPPNQEKITN